MILNFLKNIIILVLISSFVLFSQSVFGQENSQKKSDAITLKAKLIAAYRGFKADEASMIIDLLRKEVGENPNSKGYIVVYCGKICQYGEIEAHLRGIKLALELKGADEKQFIVISGGFQEKTTAEFWLVPENACPPNPNSTIKNEM